MTSTTDPKVFISYASRDRERVIAITRELAAAGVSLWRDQKSILGGDVYGEAIVNAIKHARVLLLMCSDASLRSRNVKQEILLAWKYGVPYLPLLLEPVSFPEQVEYWLEGWQWIEVLDRPPADWQPQVLESLAALQGPAAPGTANAASAGSGLPLVRPVPTLADLWRLARYTDQFWPIPAARSRGNLRGLRDLGEGQDSAQRVFRLGDAVRLVLESDRTGHLLLLDQGTSGKLYCLCPSAFAPDTRIQVGRTELPQAGSAYDAFTVTGRPGREQVLAIMTEEPLGLDWGTDDLRVPARVLSLQDSDDLLSRLCGLEDDRWVALATGFEVAP